MRKQRYGNAWRVDVSFIFENGDFHLFAGDGTGLASCDLWADIAPSMIDDGDYIFVGIYLESHFTENLVKLEGRREDEARKILEADKDWREWAAVEVSTMIGETVSGYEPLRAYDVVECGRRL